MSSGPPPPPPRPSGHASGTGMAGSLFGASRSSLPPQSSLSMNGAKSAPARAGAAPSSHLASYAQYAHPTAMTAGPPPPPPAAAAGAGTSSGHAAALPPPPPRPAVQAQKRRVVNPYDFNAGFATSSTPPAGATGCQRDQISQDAALKLTTQMPVPARTPTHEQEHHATMPAPSNPFAARAGPPPAPSRPQPQQAPKAVPPPAPHQPQPKPHIALCSLPSFESRPPTPSSFVAAPATEGTGVSSTAALPEPTRESSFLTIPAPAQTDSAPINPFRRASPNPRDGGERIGQPDTRRWSQTAAVPPQVGRVSSAGTSASEVQTVAQLDRVLNPSATPHDPQAAVASSEAVPHALRHDPLAHPEVSVAAEMTKASADEKTALADAAATEAVAATAAPLAAVAPRPALVRGSSGSRARTQFDRLMKREVPAFLRPSPTSRTHTPRRGDTGLSSAPPSSSVADPSLPSGKAENAAPPVATETPPTRPLGTYTQALGPHQEDEPMPTNAVKDAAGPLSAGGNGGGSAGSQSGVAAAYAPHSLIRAHPPNAMVGAQNHTGASTIPLVDVTATPFDVAESTISLPTAAMSSHHGHALTTADADEQAQAHDDVRRYLPNVEMTDDSDDDRPIGDVVTASVANRPEWSGDATAPHVEATATGGGVGGDEAGALPLPIQTSSPVGSRARPSRLASMLLEPDGSAECDATLNSVSFYPHYAASESSPMSRAQSALPAGLHTDSNPLRSDGGVLLAGEVLLNASECAAAMGAWSPRSGAMEPTPPLPSGAGSPGGTLSLATPPPGPHSPHAITPNGAVGHSYQVPSLPLGEMRERLLGRASAVSPPLSSAVPGALATAPPPPPAINPFATTHAALQPLSVPPTVPPVAPESGVAPRQQPPPPPASAQPQPQPQPQQLTPRGRLPRPHTTGQDTPNTAINSRTPIQRGAGQRVAPLSYAMSPYVREASSVGVDSPVPLTPREDDAHNTVEMGELEEDGPGQTCSHPGAEEINTGAPALDWSSRISPHPHQQEGRDTTHAMHNTVASSSTASTSPPDSRAASSAARRGHSPHLDGVQGTAHHTDTTGDTSVPTSANPFKRPKPLTPSAETLPEAKPTTIPPPSTRQDTVPDMKPLPQPRPRRHPYTPCFAICHPRGGLVTVCVNRPGALVRPAPLTARASTEGTRQWSTPVRAREEDRDGLPAPLPKQWRLLDLLDGDHKPDHSADDVPHHHVDRCHGDVGQGVPACPRTTASGRAYAGLVRAVANTQPFFASTDKALTYRSLEHVPSSLLAALQEVTPAPFLDVLSSVLDDALSPDVAAFQWSKGGGKSIAALLGVAQERVDQQQRQEQERLKQRQDEAREQEKDHTSSRQCGTRRSVRSSSPRNAQWTPPAAAGAVMPVPGAVTDLRAQHPAIGKPSSTDGEDDEDALAVIQRLLAQGAREAAVEVALSSGLHTHAIIISMMCESKDLYVKSIRAVVEKELEKSSPLAHAYCLFNEVDLPPFVSSEGCLDADAGATCHGDEEAKPNSDQTDRTRRQRERAELLHTWRAHAATLACNYTRQSAQGLLTLGDSLLRAGLILEAHTCFLIAHLTPQASPLWRHGQTPARPLRPEQESTMNALQVRLGVLGGFYHPATGCRAGFLSMATTLLTDMLQEARLAADVAHAARVASAPDGDLPARTHGLPTRGRRQAFAFHVAQALWLAEVGLVPSAHDAARRTLSTLPAPQHPLCQGPPCYLEELLFIFAELPPPPPLSHAAPERGRNESDERAPSVPAPQAPAPITADAAPQPAVSGSVSTASSLPPPPSALRPGQSPHAANGAPPPGPPRPSGQQSAFSASSPPPSRSSGPLPTSAGSPVPRPAALPTAPPPVTGVVERLQPSSPPTAGPPTSLPRGAPPGAMAASRSPPEAPGASATPPIPPPQPPSQEPSALSRGRAGDARASECRKEEHKKPTRSRSMEALLGFFRRGGDSASSSDKPGEKKKKDEAKPMILDTEKPPKYDPVLGRWMVEETEEEKAQAEMVRRGPPKMPLRVANPHGSAPPAAQGPSGGQTPPATAAASSTDAGQPSGAAEARPRPQGMGPPPRRGTSASVGRRQYVDMFNSS